MRRVIAIVFSFASFVTCAPSTLKPSTTVAQKPIAPIAPSPPSPRAEKPAYPNTPRQMSPWTAPRSALDDAFVSAAKKLFEQGLADPRDLPYREIEIKVGEPWAGGGDKVKTHGWVFAEKFAVAWNGLVYEIESAGGPADLRADMKKLLDDDDAAKKKYETDHPDASYSHFPNTSEAYFTATSSPTLVKVMLLLRLGETSLAEHLWTNVHPQGVHDPKRDPYLEGASDWLWALYDRGLTAHMRGDVDLALESLRSLPDLSKAVDAECAARKIDRGYGAKPDAPYVSFLDRIADVVIEMRRRATTKLTTLDAAGIAALAPLPQADRIQKLIDALESVSARQMGQPGGVALGEDPIVQALIAEGEPAVDALIAVFENDTRLTRSVQFWRDFSRYRSVLAVYEAAYVALSGIFDASFFQAASTGDHLTARGVEGRREVGKKIREYRAKWKGVSLDERSYRMLLDDAAGADVWILAADKITQPSNVQIIPSSNVFQTSMTTSLAPGQKPTLRGEALRTKTPSVSSLFATRMHAMPDARHACALATAFAAWDPPAALPHVSAFVKGAIGSWSTSTEKSSVGRCIASLTTARADAGDATALGDYGAWIAKTNPKDAEYDLESWFAPMIAHPTSSPVVRAANVIFSAPSPWVPFVSETASYMGERILDLDLYKLAAFKTHVAAMLQDKKRIGSVTIQSRDNIEVKTSSFTSSRGADAHDPRMPADGTVMNLRVCDEYAAVISASQTNQTSHPPVFQVYWRESDRDAALVQMSAWLKTR